MDIRQFYAVVKANVDKGVALYLEPLIAGGWGIIGHRDGNWTVVELRRAQTYKVTEAMQSAQMIMKTLDALKDVA